METPYSIKRLSALKDIVDRFLTIHVCKRCLLRICGEQSPHAFRDPDAFLSKHNFQFPVGTDSNEAAVKHAHNGTSPNGTHTDVNGSKEESGNPVCPCCMGLLTDSFCSPKFLDDISKFVTDNGYTLQTFWCSLTTPNTMEVRQKIFDDYFDLHSSSDPLKVRGRMSIKDIWKSVVTTHLTAAFNARWTGHDGLEINLLLESDETATECEPLRKKFPSAFQEKRDTDGKMKRIVTRQALERLLQKIHAEDFLEMYPFPPKTLTKPLTLAKINCLPCSFFIGGRYLKYSRTLSQTPWWMDGDEERKGESSVEELIIQKIQDKFHCESHKFMSSGREDFDVRMLGNGRPFVFELVGAKVAVVSAIEMMTLQDSINSSTKDIEVRDLHVISKEAVSIIKAGEEEKTKTYSALCECVSPVTQEDLDRINAYNSKELRISQRTPVRVLHRRANAERPKMIHFMKAEKVDGNGNQFRLTVKTQAGTYIKEFIHSDFGRTKPSVTKILGKQTECEELDVTAVDLEWPPVKLS